MGSSRHHRREDAAVRAEMQRGFDHDKPPDPVGMQAAEHRRQGAAQRMAGDEHAVAIAGRRDGVGAAQDQPVGVIGQPERRSLLGRLDPLRHIDPESRFQIAADDADMGQQVPDVAALDRRRNDQQGRAAGSGLLAVEPKAHVRIVQH